MADRTVADRRDVSGRAPARARAGADRRDPRPPERARDRRGDPSGRTPPAPGIGDIVPTDLDAPELYLNRELTYLNFCWRVLHEAEDERIAAARAR